MDKISIRFPANAILSYREETIEASDHKDDFMDIERAEINEKLGTAYFYNGDYAECIPPFTAAYAIMRENKELSKIRAYYKVSLLVRLIQFIFLALVVMNYFVTAGNSTFSLGRNLPRRKVYYSMHNPESCRP